MSTAHNLSHEQQLINALIGMIKKMGGNAVMKDLIEQADRDGDPKRWTEEELKTAIGYVKWQSENIGQPDALAIISILIEKYHIDLSGTTLGGNGE